jgi:tRNA threonylcarbamoyladenosine biosynthesis protein TsaE
MQRRFVSRSEEETLEFARELAESLPIPTRLLLVGDLGAGKTTFTRGLALGLGVDDPGEVSSPTFTLVNRYAGRVPVYHIDLYRIEGGDIDGLGLEEIFEDPKAVAVVEWADRLGGLEVERALHVTLTYIDSGTRQITIQGG